MSSSAPKLSLALFPADDERLLPPLLFVTDEFWCASKNWGAAMLCDFFIMASAE